MLSLEESNMINLIVEFFDIWQTIATKKEIHDQILAEQRFSLREMYPIFGSLSFMVESNQLTFMNGYYSKNW